MPFELLCKGFALSKFRHFLLQGLRAGGSFGSFCSNITYTYSLMHALDDLSFVAGVCSASQNFGFSLAL